MDLFTIGFTKKTANEFFSLLEKNRVKRIIDVRLNNKSQLAGFTKENDLRFFLERISGIEYEWWAICAPPEELLKRYQNDQVDWAGYQVEYNSMLNKRNIIDKVDINKLNSACILCSEPTAEQCHRRLLAEYFKKNIDGLQIHHL